MKLLTITVPCFNSEEYLSRCLDSLVTGGDEVEVIVVDDGSVDRTGEIAEKYARWFPEIVTVVHKENGGHGSGVNTGYGSGKSPSCYQRSRAWRLIPLKSRLCGADRLSWTCSLLL